MTRRVSGVVPNLVNGVSQQAPALRLPSQGEAQDNLYSTIIDGLKDRPPTEFVARLKSSMPAGAFVHVINRDVNERYIMICDGTSIEVYDFDGNSKTVSAPNGYTYLNAVVNPKADLAALTIHDYTFIVNRNRNVLESTTTAPARDPEALVNILQGDYGKKYRIVINGVVRAAFKTGSVNANLTDTSEIASILMTGKMIDGTDPPDGNVISNLDGSGINAGNGWTVTRYGNAIYISKASEFDITVEDGAGGRMIKAVKERTQHFSDLPYYGPDGFVCEIIGDDNTTFDNYWVKIDAQGSGTNNQVVWRETVKPGVKLNLQPASMPHTLVRNGDGTFTFDQATWDPRKCGDESISPPPSFVGQPIEAVYLHHDRLTFLSGENAVMSRTGSFFDFFRTSATALLDDDPIDIGAAHDKVSLLKGAVAYQKQLLVFSDQTQFLLSGNGDQLTPKTASMLPITGYVSDPGVVPVAIGTSVFFAAVRGNWEAVWEYTIQNTANGPMGDAADTTESSPSYIPSGLFKLMGTSNENVIVGLTEGDPDGLYVYRYYYQDNKKVQSSWSRWTLPGVGVVIHNGAFINSDLFLVVERTDGVYIEKMQMAPSAKDDGVDYVVHLDHRVSSANISAGSYDSDTNTTTYTLPWRPIGSTKAVTTANESNPIAGLEITVAGRDNFDITLSGDTTDLELWFGNTYERRYRFSEFFVRQGNGAGGSITLQNGRLQISYLTIDFSNTSYFTVEVTPLGRSKRTYVYTGRILGSPDNILGSVPLTSGSKTFPILSRSNRVIIEIVTDSWMPSAFVSALWSGTHNDKAKDF